MKFGKPTLTAEPQPQPEKIRATYYKVTAGVSGNLEWTWQFRGDDAYVTAKKLVDKLTGVPDEQGWIRNLADDWAYKATEIGSVAITTHIEEVPAA